MVNNLSVKKEQMKTTETVFFQPTSLHLNKVPKEKKDNQMYT